MGITAENIAEKYNISREDQDKLAVSSHQRATRAIEEGVFKDQILPIEIRVKRDTKMYDTDEFVRRDATVEGLAKLKPVFKPDGTVTAGNASGINDAAAAVVLMEAREAEKRGLKPMARLVAYATGGVEHEIMGMGPVPAVKKVLETPVTVHWDPINSYDDDAIAEQRALLDETKAMIDDLYRRVESLQTLQKQVELRKEIAEGAKDDALAEAAGDLLERLSEWQRAVTTPERDTFPDVLNFHPEIDTFLIDLYGQADRAVLGLTDGQRRRLEDLRPQWQEAIDAWDKLVNEDVAAFNASAGPALAVPDWE